MKEARWSRPSSSGTWLCVTVIVATMNGGSATAISCTGLPTFPGGCNPEFVDGACFSTVSNVNWACGTPESTNCRSVPVPPGQSLRRNYEGWCSFSSETQTSSTATSSTATTSTATSSTATSSTATTISVTTSTTTSSSSTSLTTSSTVTMTTTLPHAPAGSPVDKFGHLRVVGNQIVGEHNQSVKLRGMSLFWSQWGDAYWNEKTLRWLRRDWGIELIRAAMGIEPGAYLEYPERELRKVKRVVWAAHRLGIYVIVDWHDHHAELHSEQAKHFFNEIAKSYGHMPNVLFETFNEPTHHSWSKQLRPYHEEVLKVIRRHSNNIVICGTPMWSQDVDAVPDDPVNGSNIAYTLHFYAGTHHQWLRDKAKRALDQGVALFVSEWGTCEANGNGGLNFAETKKWMDFLAEYNMSDANWAVNDKTESCSALRPRAATNGHWRRRDLTRSGRWVRKSLRRHAFGPIDDANMTNASTSEADRRLQFSDLPIDATGRCQALAVMMLGLGLFQIL